MNQNNSNIPLSEDVKNVLTSKSLKPAKSGVPNSHGVKLAVKMTSEDKKQFLSKLEEWKKAKRERLAASILAKQKQAENSKTSTVALPQKNKLLTAQGRDGNLKNQNQESVFERLYKNNGRRKKQECTGIQSSKSTVISDTNFKKPNLLPTEKLSKTVKIWSADKEKTEFLPEISLINKEHKIPTSYVETSAPNYGFESVNDIVKTQRQMNKDDSNKCFFEGETEIKQTVKSISQPVSDQIQQIEKKSVQSDLVTAKEVEVEKKKNPSRISTSMKFRQKSRKEFALRRSISAKNLHEINLNLQKVKSKSLAALHEHESKGDQKSATEDDEQATIKGSEVDLEGNSLAQLFDKMVIEQANSKHKLEKGLDPKNIFKSTTIKFALQQKTLKKSNSENHPTIQQLYIVTPVRRSTRIQSPFKSNEKVASLHTLTPKLLKNVYFKTNESLL